MNTPLVLLHGWGVNSAVWQRLIPILESGNFEPVVIDLPGYGNDLDFQGDYSLDAIVAEVLSQAPEHALWVGWSLGATIAMAAAIAQPNRFNKLQLISPTPCFSQTDDWQSGVDMAAFEAIAGDFENDYEKALRKFLLLQAFTNNRTNMNDARELVRELSQSIVAGGQPTNQTLAGGLEILRQSDLRNHLPALTVETQVIAGRDDQVIPVEASQYVFDHLPNAESIHVFDAGHLPFLQEPSLYIEALTNFSKSDQ